MYIIDETVIDGDTKYRVRLNPTQSLTIYTLPPIIWNGYINNKKVSLIQIDKSASDRMDFDFTDLPIEFDCIKTEIISLINKAIFNEVR